MALTVNQNLPVIAAQAAGSATSGIVLQSGTVVDAQVLKVAENLVQIVIAGLSIDVMSEVALTPGQNLQLAVSQTGDGTVRLALVGQGVAAPSTDTAGVANTAGAATNAPVNTPASTPAIVNTIAAPAPVAAPVPSDPLTPLERIAVSVASETAATQQQSLAPLFANLNVAATSSSLPPLLQQAVAQVLAQQTPLAPGLSGGDIANAVQTSGLFLESSLATGSLPPTGIPDLKAALIVLRQTLTAAVQTVETPQAVAPAISTGVTAETRPAIPSPSLIPAQPEQAQSKQIPSAQVSAPADHEIATPQARLQLPSLAADTRSSPTKLVFAEALLSAGPKSVTSGAALNLLQEALQELPRLPNQPQTATVILPGGQSEEAVVHTNTPPPPFRGALPSAQPVTAPSIAPDAPLATTVRHLLDDTDAAIARQTLLQVASLPDQPDASGGRVAPTMPRWHFEIPFATPQGTAMAQFEISRDGGGNEVEATKRVWRARFSLDIEPAGPVHALISLIGDRTSVRMWAERPQTASLLRAGANDLSQALSQAELAPGDIVIREGTPPQAAPAKAGHFLDRAL
ncbi:MAG TPA: flagellar hook-length control protein FliK [Bradyrhizobium sp.]